MNVLIEVAISMVGLYIIFSIVNSALVEGYAQFINKRGNFLKESLDNFFKDPVNSEINLAEELYNHKLVRAFMEKNKVLPSWIDPKIFTQAFMELVFKDTHTAGAKFTGELREGAKEKLPGDLDKTLQFILNKATEEEGINMGKVQEEIEGLYDSYMVRVSEWYKKKMKYLLMGAGIALAFVLNLDSINFYTALKNDGELRREQVQISKNLYDNQSEIRSKLNALKDSVEVKSFDLDEVQQSLDNVVAQVLSKEQAENFENNLSELKIGIHQFRKGKKTTEDYMWGIFGVCLTGFALSFGSTFWFGLLKKLVGK
ncbi:MAG: hypothetical protein AAGA77_11010 [Bacteroidota bacterium]